MKQIDLTQLSYCGIACFRDCKLYKATVENDIEAKRLLYNQWEMKKHFGFEFDPGKVFCYGCKPSDKPFNKNMAYDCKVRNCASANAIESCVQCRHLAACDKEVWKKWIEAYENAKRLQAEYITQPEAFLLEMKNKV